MSPIITPGCISWNILDKQRHTEREIVQANKIDEEAGMILRIPARIFIPFSFISLTSKRYYVILLPM